jgi:hypothetical protein
MLRGKTQITTTEIEELNILGLRHSRNTQEHMTRAQDPSSCKKTGDAISA